MKKLLLAVLFVGPLMGEAQAQALSYEFAPAPQTDLNRVYRVDTATGEMSACQYGLQEGTLGVTLCYGAGEGGAAQPASRYGLIASRHEREGGVFRVNYRSGEMSICYVFDEKVVCTPPSSQAQRAQGSGSASTPQKP